MTRFLVRVPPSVWIVLAWGIASLPNLSIREFQWEEGNNAGLARDILARGDLLEPEIFGLRFAEKPSLLPWTSGQPDCHRWWPCWGPLSSCGA